MNGKHAAAAAAVDGPLTSLLASPLGPLHSANENGLLIQENQGGERHYLFTLEVSQFGHRFIASGARFHAS
jgi:hypothetical protein